MTQPVLPHIPGKKVVKALEKAGFTAIRQKGSHVVMRHTTDLSRRVVIPLHGTKDVKPGTLRAIIKGAGLTVEEFVTLLK